MDYVSSTQGTDPLPVPRSTTYLGSYLPAAVNGMARFLGQNFTIAMSHLSYLLHPTINLRDNVL